MNLRAIGAIAVLAIIWTFYVLSIVKAATTRYVSQSGGLFSGGTNCNGQTAISVATFNGTAQSAGDINWVCGTLTAAMTPSGNGGAGNVVSIKFDTGAAITVGTCPSTGCINLNGLSHYLIDGGTACGYVSQVDTACNGVISATNSGTGLSNGGPGIYARGTTDVEVRNLALVNLYVHTGSGNDTNNGGPAYGVQLDGSSSHIHNLVCHDDYSCVSVGSALTATIEVDHFYAYNVNWGVSVFGISNVNTTTAIKVHDFEIRDFTSWDTSSDTFHHDGVIVAGNDNLADSVSNVAIYNGYIHGAMGTCCMTSMGYFNDGNHVSWYNILMVANNGEGVPGGILQFYSPGTLNSNDLMANVTVVGGFVNGDNCITVKGDASLTLSNNVSSNCKNTLIDVWTSMPATTFTAITNNTYQDSSLTGVWATTASGTNTFYNTLTAWKTAIGGGSAESGSQSTTGSLGVNALYVPQPGSILIAAGTNLTTSCSGLLTALCSDALGNARPGGATAWDAGANNKATASTFSTPTTAINP